MKKKILMLGVVLALVMALVIPTAVLATTTDVGGDVVTGYTFSPPSAIDLGNMSPGTPATATSSDGSLEGNNASGYTVTGIDAKGSNTGFMVVGANVLSNKLNIGPSASPAAPLTYGPADTAQTFVSTSAITDVAVSLYASQLAAYDDTVAVDYAITITFTVVAK